jgi:hypothetical protein
VSCTDGIKNGSEAGTDCGGTCTTKCGTGTNCNSGTDCGTGVCYQTLCCAPKDCAGAGAQCGTITNGCGGQLTCPNCSNSLQCQSNHCVCVDSSCPGCVGTRCCKSSTQCGCKFLGFGSCQ